MAKAKTEQTEQKQVKKAQKLTIDVKTKIVNEKKIIIREENIIVGKCEYVCEYNKLPTNILMNIDALKHATLSGMVKDGKLADCNIIVDNSIDDSQIIFT